MNDMVKVARTRLGQLGQERREAEKQHAQAMRQLDKEESKLLELITLYDGKKATAPKRRRKKPLEELERNQAAERAVLDVLRNAEHPMSQAEIRKKAKLRQSHLTTALRFLVHEDKAEYELQDRTRYYFYITKDMNGRGATVKAGEGVVAGRV